MGAPRALHRDLLRFLTYCVPVLRRLFVTLATSALLLGSLPAAIALDTRVIDVAAVTWAGAKSSYTVDSVESSIKNEVGRRWKDYTTLEGAKEDRSITFEHGRTLSTPISLIRPMACEGSEASSFMNSIRQEAYKRLGIEDYSKRYLVILSPEAGCIWSGRALIGSIKNPSGVMTLHNSASAFIIVHELGHAMGLGHSNFLRCESAKNDGPWGSDCKAVEYGGAIDVMSNVDVDAPLSVYSQWILGYLEKSEIHQSWLTEKIELSASDVIGGTRAIFARDGKSTYWIEYRRAKVGSPYKPGLVIYRSDPPPISAVVSPNPEDNLSPEFDEDVTADIWMLNWDNYTYFRSKASGSMTLPEGETATLFSGNLSISASASASPNKVTVSVTRTADTTPPSAPEITDPSGWRYPDISIIRSGFDDGESAIASFEADISGKVVPINASDDQKFSATYLSPISAPKTVYLKDLPEGDYSISLRAIDVWGNKGPWSKSVKAYVDRGNPVVTKEFLISSIDSAKTVLSWSGVRDEGIGLCSTILHNEEGFVLGRSSEKVSPKLSFPTGSELKAKAQVFDCLGNGMSGALSISSKFISATDSKRTGKWIAAPASYGQGALKCAGKCTASISTKGPISVLFGEGAIDVKVSNKSALKSSSPTTGIRYSQVINVGSANRVVRVTGSNFVFAGLAGVEFTVGEFKALAKTQEFPDPSLADPTQKTMSALGFNGNDFTQDWTVLPMARGTTLLDPTLDLCSANYPSESGRQVRRQISVTRVGSPYAFLSTESVRYRSVSAAEAALADLKKNYEACISNKGGIENGIFTPYAFQSLPKSNAKLVDEKNRVIVRATIGSGVASRQLLAFYQYNGVYFTGLYVVSNSENPISDGEALRWFDVAAVLAERLQSFGSN